MSDATLGPSVLRRLGRALLIVLLPVLLLGVMLGPAARASDDQADPLAGLCWDVPQSLLSVRGVADDWDHVTQVVSWLRHRPRRHAIYLLGGSATRESIVSEGDWSAQLSRMSGVRAASFVLASSCQTFVEDELIVRALPRDRGSVIINVGTSRFIMVHAAGTIRAHSVRQTPPVVWYQHHYDRVTPHTWAQKRAFVEAWVQDGYPGFQARYPSGLAELEEVIRACEERGLGCALLDMPLNLPIIGDDFDVALAMYRQGCLDLTIKHEIKFIRFVSGVRLRNGDFHDLQHLLASGRAKWQARLSREILRKRLL